jgi:hypothetical protein
VSSKVARILPSSLSDRDPSVHLMAIALQRRSSRGGNLQRGRYKCLWDECSDFAEIGHMVLSLKDNSGLTSSQVPIDMSQMLIAKLQDDMNGRLDALPSTPSSWR